jgi:photosynthetic reaction center cytochrome c subunit
MIMLKQTIRFAAIAFAACLFNSAIAQTRPDQKNLMSEQAFKNVKVLKGIPANQFMATMGFFSASLAENCGYCHVAEAAGSWDKYADDNEHKVVARRMILMVANINKNFFNGRRVVTCYSCHRGGERPRITPSLVDLYGPPPTDEIPDSMVDPINKGQTAEQVLDKYIQALGGAQRLSTLTSFTGKGTYQGYADAQITFDIYAKAGARTTVVHAATGDTTTTYDGKGAWIAGPAAERPISPLELTGGDFDGAKLDAEVTFPSRIKQLLTQWRIGLPATIDDMDVVLVQGTMDGRFPINLYFDPKTNLLVRSVRYTDSPVGLNPTQVDYADYREVAGVKMPFKWTVTWLDGRAKFGLTDVQANARIDDSRFAKPAAPAKR